MTEGRSRVPRRGLDQLFERAVLRQTGNGVRFGLSIALPLLALVAVDLSRDVLPGGGAFLVLLVPVTIVAIAFGFVPGLVALILGAVGVWLLVPVRGHPWLSDPVDLVRLGLYLVIGAAVLAMASAPRRPLDRSTQSPPLELPATSDAEPPTQREREVLALAAAGLTTRAIGRRLFLSENTVKWYLARIYGKLGVRNRAEAVVAGLQAGWISADLSLADANEGGS